MKTREMVLEMMDLPDSLRPTDYAGMISTLKARYGMKDGNSIDPVQMSKLLNITIPGSEEYILKKGERNFMDSIELKGAYIVEKKDLGQHNTFTGVPEPIRETEVVLQEVEIPVVHNITAEEMDEILTIAIITKLLENRNLPTEGNKATLIDRLTRPDLPT